MKSILHITSSINGSDSLSGTLSRSIVEKLSGRFPGSRVTTRELMSAEVPHLNAATFDAFRSIGNDKKVSPSSIDLSNQLIDELLGSDIIVIGVPLYNFGIPSVLKAWIDHVARAGVTFSYSANGVEGLAKGKKAYLAITSGGIYSEGPMKALDFSEPYLKAVLGFIGIKDVTTFRIEGTAIPEIGTAQIEKGFSAVNEYKFEEELALSA